MDEAREKQKDIFYWLDFVKEQGPLTGAPQANLTKLIMGNIDIYAMIPLALVIIVVGYITIVNLCCKSKKAKVD